YRQHPPRRREGRISRPASRNLARSPPRRRPATASAPPPFPPGRSPPPAAANTGWPAEDDARGRAGSIRDGHGWAEGCPARGRPGCRPRRWSTARDALPVRPPDGWDERPRPRNVPRNNAAGPRPRGRAGRPTRRGSFARDVLAPRKKEDLEHP